MTTNTTWQSRIKFREVPYEIEIDGNPVCELNQLFDFISTEIDWAKVEAVEGEKRKGRGLRHYYSVAQHLRQFARDRFVKPDERSDGFYEAIKEIERYFGVSEDMLNLLQF